MSTFSLVAVTKNRKVGPMAVTTSPRAQCPPSCAVYSSLEGYKRPACYACYDKLAWHWNAVNAGERGTAWDDHLNGLRALPTGSELRLNDGGDLPGTDNRLNRKMCLQLARAVAHLKVILFTHYPLLAHPQARHNRAVLRAMASLGLHANVSANTLKMAVAAKRLAMPVAVMVPERHKHAKHVALPDGSKAIVCPAVRKDEVTCKSCMLCSHPNRPPVAFPVHGTGRKQAESIIVDLTARGTFYR